MLDKFHNLIYNNIKHGREGVNQQWEKAFIFEVYLFLIKFVII